MCLCLCLLACVFVCSCGYVSVCGTAGAQRIDSLGARVIGGCELPVKPSFAGVQAGLPLLPLRRASLKTRHEHWTPWEFERDWSMGPEASPTL